MSSLCDDFDDSDDMEVGFDGIRSLCVALDFIPAKSPVTVIREIQSLRCYKFTQHLGITTRVDIYIYIYIQLYQKQ